MYISLVADYGVGDPAFLEVSQRLLKEIDQAQIHHISVPPFNTLATGFWIAQLGLNVGPSPRLVYHNCAPRQDDPHARLDNEGEGLTYALLPNGVKVVGVNAGYTLSFIKNYAQVLRIVNVSRGGSQFRSRDVFPLAAGSIIRGEEQLLGDEIPPEKLPDPPPNRIAWVDGYGNIKTTIPAHTVSLEPESKIYIRIGDLVSDALYCDGSFKVPEGSLAFAPGSSGWSSPDGKQQWKFMELFLRGGNAWTRFGKPPLTQEITILS